MPGVEAVIAGFLVLTILASIISRRIRVPYTQFLVVLGVILATLSVSSVIGIDFINNNLVSGGYFVALILPPLLFEAMMNVRSGELKSIIRPAISLATVGVVISTLVGGLLLWQLAGMPASTSFLFAALISPTDTATVLEIFRRVKVPSRLAALMETEAAFNDATGVIIFSAILTSLTVAEPSIIGAVFGFAVVFVGGVVVGFLVAFGTEILTSLVNDPLGETIVTIISVYGSYSLATYLGVSGLIAVAVSGLYYGNLTMYATVSDTSRSVVKSFWETIAFIANSVAFLFIGLSTDIFQLAAGSVAILVAFLAVSWARAASVYPVLGLFGRTAEKIPPSWRNVAMLGGMRGALSIVLAASLPESVPLRSVLVTMVLGVTFVSITLQGPLLYRYASVKFADIQQAAGGGGQDGPRVVHRSGLLRWRAASLFSAITTGMRRRHEPVDDLANG